MSDVIEARTSWTAADLVERFGPIALTRIRTNPAPGTATEADVVRIHAAEDRLYELIDQTLVEKTVGTYESYLAAELVRLLGNFVVEHDLGIVLGADGIMRLGAGSIRIPDASFISWDRLSDRKIPDRPIADFVPDLAVEVISPSNTREEMQRELRDYFAAGVGLVWYVYPRTHEVHVYKSTEQFQAVSKTENLTGENVLPGFSLPLANFFAYQAK